MKTLLGFLALVYCGCSTPKFFTECTPKTPTIEGSWELTEYKYYGGCCPNIPDKGFQKIVALENKRLTITADKFSITQATGTLSTTFVSTDATITLKDNIFGTASIWKELTIVNHTTAELILKRPAGKEGEQQEEKYARVCP
jgi:hypothetical protein